ncbi:MAG: RHS repeat-associated core domain-containing protein, partial [Flavobacteriales bacterium]|nr:RHS repeat-associated core domain-containing protein [Flavobacteriales bacterium]
NIKDHLGNTRLTFADLNGNGSIEKDQGEVMQEQHYYPFGMKMEGPWSTISGTENLYQYNGKELNTDFGLDWLDYGARWYDPSIARWHAIDPLADDFSNWNPYHYVHNNPMKLVDPTGMNAQDPIEGNWFKHSRYNWYLWIESDASTTQDDSGNRFLNMGTNFTVIRDGITINFRADGTWDHFNEEGNTLPTVDVNWEDFGQTLGDMSPSERGFFLMKKHTKYSHKEVARMMYKERGLDYDLHQDLQNLGFFSTGGNQFDDFVSMAEFINDYSDKSPSYRKFSQDYNGILFSDLSVREKLVKLRQLSNIFSNHPTDREIHARWLKLNPYWEYLEDE